MRGAGAAKRQREAEPPPQQGIAAAVARLERVSGETDALLGRMRRRDGEIEAAAARISGLPAECASAAEMAAQAGRIGSRQAVQVVECIALAAHWAEAREVLEQLGPQLAALYEMGVTEGRDRERRAAAERDAAPRARQGRHAARSRRLKVVGGITAGSAVAASLVAGGAVVTSHESALVHPYAAGRPVVRFHADPADSAVLMPSSPPRAYVPKHAKPSADAASASPAPSSAPSSPAPPPPVPSPVPSHVDFDGVLDVQTAECVITSDGGCKITFTAVGGEVSWAAQSSSPDLSLSASGGTLEDGHPGTVGVTVRAGALAGTGTVTLTDGHGNATQVQVTWVAVPGLPV